MKEINRSNTEHIRNIVYAGLFAAMTTLLTATLHIPSGNGYIHCGDAVIFLSAVFLPLPYAIAASAVGGMLADVLTGYFVYALPTFIIKGLLALTFSLIAGHASHAAKKETDETYQSKLFPTLHQRLLGKAQFAALIACGIVSTIGYWITAVILYGGWAAQFAETLPGNIVQAVGSSIVYTVIAFAMDRVRKAKPQYLF